MVEHSKDQTTDYKIVLDVFEGPLDLLLRLIEQKELDITKVSLALVTDQYLEHLALVRQVQAAPLASFLAVAAKLLVIKSRALLPRSDDLEKTEEEEDIGGGLTRQLLEYKRFREVADALKSIEESGLKAYPRIAPPPQIEPRVRPGSASPDDLLTALKRVLEDHPPTPAVDEVVSPVTIRVAECIEHIDRLLRKYSRVRLSSVLRRTHSRLEVIVHFLAVLAMIKEQQLWATQSTLFGEIYLERLEPKVGHDPESDVSDEQLHT